MNRCIIVDARMGRGKTSAAIRYLMENSDRLPFVYLTPFLSEVSRVCSSCFVQSPEGRTKLPKFKELLRERRSIATTHSLFTFMDEETLDLIERGGYGLIVDESLPMVEVIRNVRASDRELMFSLLATSDEEGKVLWKDQNYRGFMNECRIAANLEGLYNINGVLYRVIPPRFFSVFKEVFFLTYMFKGGGINAYLDFFGFPYDVVGIRRDEYGTYFSDEPDNPPAIDFSGLITVAGDPPKSEPDRKLNLCGTADNALSLSWFKHRGKENDGVIRLRHSMVNFVNRYNKRKTKGLIWTTYEGAQSKIFPDGKFSTRFLPLNTRAVNGFHDCCCVGYLANRYLDPRINDFYQVRGVSVDNDVFAVSEVLQFVWRSAVRNNEPISLYLPSRRMRDLLKRWMMEQSREPRPFVGYEAMEQELTERADELIAEYESA